MSSFRASCSAVFVCSAILCWNHQNATYTFSNFTRCTPNSLYFRPTVHLIPQNNKFFKIEEKSYENGFICSYCKRKDFIESHNLRLTSRCREQRTRIQLKNYCHSIPSESVCQCVPSAKPIQFINDWTQALVRSGKDKNNVNRYLRIHQSGSVILYLLMGLFGFIVLLGGMISMIFYSIKSNSRLVK